MKFKVSVNFILPLRNVTNIHMIYLNKGGEIALFVEQKVFKNQDGLGLILHLHL